jgi:hypothetical protein
MCACRGIWELARTWLINLIHPRDDFSVEGFRDGKVGHCCGCRCAMPMFDAWRYPGGIARLDLLYRTFPVLNQPSAGSHDQRPAQRMRMPNRASARLERDNGAARTRRPLALETGVDANTPVKCSAGPLVAACVPTHFTRTSTAGRRRGGRPECRSSPVSR